MIGLPISLRKAACRHTTAVVALVLIFGGKGFISLTSFLGGDFVRGRATREKRISATCEDETGSNARLAVIAATDESRTTQ